MTTSVDRGVRLRAARDLGVQGWLLSIATLLMFGLTGVALGTATAAGVALAVLWTGAGMVGLNRVDERLREVST